MQLLKPATVFLLVVQLCWSAALAAPVKLGVDVLAGMNFTPLKGKRVGLLTNQAGRNNQGISTINLLYKAPQVNLTALFGPEHGIDGKAAAEIKVNDKRDPKTGLPVYSLYGATRKPTPEMLKDIDTLVIDLQDLGVRSYTYASTMKLAMEACFEQGKEVIVLDRPNPMGGHKVDGPPRDPKWAGFLAPFPVPYVHGLTIGELARIAKQESGWLNVSDEVRRKGKLKIIQMQGWNRGMLWSDTGLSWTPTSPNIPNISSVFGYSMTGLGAQLGAFKHGIGSQYPFRLLSYPNRSAQEIAKNLTQSDLDGFKFRHVKYKNPKTKRIDHGLYVMIDNFNTCSPTALSFHMMTLACKFSNSNPFANASKQQAALFNKHVCSTEWWNELTSRGEHARVDLFLDKWSKQAQDFKKWSKKYWIYQ